MADLPSRFELTSPLSRVEVVRVLRANVDSSWKFFGEKVVVGSIGASSFSLRIRLTYRNSFQTVLSGRVMEDQGATRIRCHSGMHGFVIALLTMWFGGVLMALFALAPFVLHLDSLDLAAPLIPVGMGLLGIGLVWFGRYLARDELGTLVAFLEETLDASRMD